MNKNNESDAIFKENCMIMEHYLYEKIPLVHACCFCNIVNPLNNNILLIQAYLLVIENKLQPERSFY